MPKSLIKEPLAKLIKARFFQEKRGAGIERNLSFKLTGVVNKPDRKREVS